MKPGDVVIGAFPGAQKSTIARVDPDMRNPTRLSFLCTFSIGVLFLPTAGMAKSKELEEVRRVSQAFIAGIQRQAPPAKMLLWFTNGAFMNPVTRQITAFTGGDFNASPARIREYVSETLARAARSSENSKARCPDPAVVMDFLVPGFEPDNDPSFDGFLLKFVTREVLNSVEAEASPTEPQVEWLRNQIQKRRSIIVMAVACNDVPMAVAWGRAKSGRWLIEAFAVPMP